MPLPVKPVEIPEWATSAVNVITPPAGKKTDGWVVTDVPPAEWQNWLHYWTEQWRAWAEAGLDDHETRIAAIENEPAPVDWEAIEPFDGGFGGGTPSFDGTFNRWSLAAGEIRYWRIPLRETLDELLAIRMRVNPTTVNAVTIDVRRSTDGTIGGSPAGSASSVGTGAQTVTFTLGSPETVITGETLIVRAAQTGGGGPTLLYTLEAQIRRN